jgi:predicted ATP-binding protein involved in virulence
MNFPYIKQIHVNNCFTYQNFNIPINALQEFKHIILTGKNGTGKTTILNRIAFQLNEFKNERNKVEGVQYIKAVMQGNRKHQNFKTWEQQLKEYSDIDLFFLSGSDENFLKEVNQYIFSFFKAHRRVELKEVSTVSKESQFVEELQKQNDAEKFASQFKQYLVNKKVYEAFDFMNSKTEGVNQNQIFFENLTSILKNVFGDSELKLEFMQESFEFYIILHDGRRITFNQLSEGFSAFISILMDLLMRVDLMRKSISDFSFNPSGIVLIDEPETHFHIEMQYEILPLLTTIFPNIQFVVATHSPAVISSIRNAVVFDLSSQREVSGWQAGSSYSELMIKHFGLENEFSHVADKILLDVNEAVQNNNQERLKEIIAANEGVLTPSLKFEIENHIIAIESKRI